MNAKVYCVLLFISLSAHADTKIKWVRNHTNKVLNIGSYTVGSCFIPQETIQPQKQGNPGINRSEISLSGPLQAQGKLYLRTADGSRQLIVDDTQGNQGCCGAWRVTLTEGAITKSACLYPKWFRYDYVTIDIYENDFQIAQAQ